MPSNKKLNLEELKVLVFEEDQATKQNKDKLFKLAKAAKDIECIERLKEDFSFKNAIKFLDDFNKERIEKIFQTMDTQLIKSVINGGMNPDVRYKEGASLLHYAAEQDNRILIEFLLEKGVDINIRQDDDVTPLLLAAQENNYETVYLLIQNGADVNLKSKNGHTPLAVSCMLHNNVDIVKLLLKNNADINIQDIHGVSPLLMATQQNYTSIVKVLLDANANPNLIANNGYSALHMPCEKGHDTIVKLLLSNGVNTNIQDNDGDTGLIIASKNGFKLIVELLVDTDIDMNVKNNNGDTALILASYTNHFEIVRLLVNKKVKVNLSAKDGTTALDFSMRNNNRLMTDFLIDAGANKISLKGNKLNTLLEGACVSGDEKLIQIFIDNSADINFRSVNGNTPLITAAYYEHLNIVNTLVENDAILDCKNNVGFTALHVAAIKQNIDIVSSLLEVGANPDVVNKEGVNALTDVVGSRMNKNDMSATTASISKKNELNVRIARLLLSKNANPNIKNKLDFSALMIAARIGDIEMAQLLLDYDAKVDIQDNLGLTPLISAAFADHYDICKLLLEYEADVNKSSTKDKATALGHAIVNNNLNLVKLLIKQGADLNHVISKITASLEPLGVHPSDIRCGTALEIAQQCSFKEIEFFLLAQIEKNEDEKIDDDLPKGKIKLKNNLSIEIYKKYLYFISRIDDEIFENKYLKDGKNKYYNEKKGYILIDRYIVQKESLVGEVIIYDIESYTGDILEHNPKSLVKLLTNFTLDTPIKYTTHEWRKRVEKKYINNFDLFINDVTNQLDIIKYDLKELSSNLSQKINDFITSEEPSQASWCSQGDIRIGWRSLKGLRKWVNDGNEPWDFPLESQITINDVTISRFGEVIKLFKAEIETTENILQDIFLAQKTRLGRKFKINISNNLEGEKIYTDVSKFQNAITEIFKEIEKYAHINNLYEIEVELHKPASSSSEYIELHIIHIDSESTRDADESLKRVQTKGDIVETYKLLTNLCDWEIKANYKGTPFKIDCFNLNDLTLEDESNVQGYTHIMRFYK